MHLALLYEEPEGSLVRFWWEGGGQNVHKKGERMKQRNTDVSGIEKLRGFLFCFFILSLSTVTV